MGGYGVSEDGLGAQFEPVETKGLVDEIVIRLREAITDGALKPGQRVVEAAIARQLGVSRAPVREAARMLAERGLLIQVPRRGFFVREISKEDICETIEVLNQLQRHAIQTAISGELPPAFDDFALFQKQLKNNPVEQQYAGAFEAELRMHRLICAMAMNRKLEEMCVALLSELKAAGSLMAEGWHITGNSLDAYGTLVRALRARNAEKADACMVGIRSDLESRLTGSAEPSTQACNTADNSTLRRAI